MGTVRSFDRWKRAWALGAIPLLAQSRMFTVTPLALSAASTWVIGISRSARSIRNSSWLNLTFAIFLDVHFVDGDFGGKGLGDGNQKEPSDFVAR